MLSGILNTKAIIHIDDIELLVLGYGMNYHFYNKLTERCVKKINTGHQSKILSVWHSEKGKNNNLLTSIDEDGNLI